jgi:cytochrome b involved in lipid metabolism
MFGIYDDNDEIIEAIINQLKSVPDFRHKIEEFLLKDKVDPKKEHVMFNHLLNNALPTFRRHWTGNRFDDQLRKFCQYLYFKGGYNCYDNLYQNTSIPATETLKHNIQEDRMQTSKLYVHDLVSFLIKHELPHEVIISEDATRILSRIEYDHQNNEILGLLAKTDEHTGMPIRNFFDAGKPSQVLDYISKNKVAPYVQIIMAKPAKIGN